MDELDWAKIAVFRGPAVEKVRLAKQNEQNFVHYTNAEAAFNILKNQEVWMRNAVSMNDYREVSHGVELMIEGWNREEFKESKSILNGIYDGIIGQVEELFNGWLDQITLNSYIICVSEHYSEEDFLGRLSMWRAYGGNAGVALVFSGKPFFREENTMNVFSSPVFYLDKEQFFNHIETISSNIKKKGDVLEKMSREEIVRHLFDLLYWSSFSIKHLGFKEEQEWRITHAPVLHPSEILLEDIVSINGRPEIIYKLPIHNQPERGITWLGLDNLVDRIIIGPTRSPYTTYDAFVKLLSRMGVTNPKDRVSVSEIPLRI